MDKTKIIGEKKNVSHDNRNLDDHKGKQFELAGEEGKWYGQEMNVESDPMIDDGTGKPYFLRCFEFGANPDVKKIPSKQDLFNSHWKQIRDFLWKDGLVHREDIPPRIVYGQKKYQIFVLAEPRFNTMVLETPQTLQQILNKKK